jgi:hypothetical protein
LGSGGARSGLASHRVAPAVLSGAAAGHDRVRDGTGWGHRALGHGHPPTPNVFPLKCVLTARLTRLHGVRTCSLVATHACHAAPCAEPVARRASWCPAGPALLATPPGERSPFRGSKCEVCPRSLGRVSSGRLPAVHLAPINPVVFRGSYLLAQWDTSSWEKIPA